MHVYNILLIGDSGVGKETMIRTYISNDDVRVRTLFADQWNVYFYVETHLKEMNLAFTHIDVPTIGGKDVFLYTANAFVLIYSSVSAASFEHLKKFVDETIKNPKNVCNVPVILVATKTDLPEQEVQSNQGLALAERWGVPFFEISATDKVRLTEMFVQLGQSIDASRHRASSKMIVEKKRDMQCCAVL